MNVIKLLKKNTLIDKKTIFKIIKNISNINSIYYEIQNNQNLNYDLNNFDLDKINIEMNKFQKKLNLIKNSIINKIKKNVLYEIKMRYYLRILKESNQILNEKLKNIDNFFTTIFEIKNNLWKKINLVLIKNNKSNFYLEILKIIEYEFQILIFEIYWIIINKKKKFEIELPLANKFINYDSQNDNLLLYDKINSIKSKKNYNKIFKKLILKKLSNSINNINKNNFIYINYLKKNLSIFNQDLKFKLNISSKKYINLNISSEKTISKINSTRFINFTTTRSKNENNNELNYEYDFFVKLNNLKYKFNFNPLLLDKISPEDCGYYNYSLNINFNNQIIILKNKFNIKKINFKMIKKIFLGTTYKNKFIFWFSFCLILIKNNKLEKYYFYCKNKLQLNKIKKLIKFIKL